MVSISQRVGWDTERSLAATAMDGTFKAIGSPLSQNPVVIIMDNQTDVSVPISVDGVNIWKTFAAGEALIIDLGTNRRAAPDYTIDLYTQFSTNAPTGTTGSFLISLIYAK